MNIPKFRRTRSFIDDVEAPCLTARLLNSVVSGLAAKEIAKDDDVPVFDVYLRAKDPKKITKWQQGMLERLFEKGELKVAIEEGMKDFQKQLIDPDPDDLADYEKRAFADIQQNGFLPHVVLGDIIIDDMQREVILRLSCNSFGHLEEHGVVIYLKKDKWKFDDDHIYDYLNEVEEEEESEREVEDFEEEPEKGKPKKAEPAFDSDLSFLYGTWVFDTDTVTALRKKEGESDREIRCYILSFGGSRFEISATRLLYWNQYSKSSKPEESEILGCSVQGKKITFKLREGKKIESFVLKYENDRLTNPNGSGTYKRA